MSTPPATSMFMRAGGSTPKRATGANDSVSQSNMSACISTYSKMPVSSAAVASGVGDGPVKVIENRSKCYHQLADLKNLSNGIRSVVRERIHFRKTSIIIKFENKGN